MHAPSILVLLATLTAGGLAGASQDPARELLRLAIAAAGGAENLQRHTVFAWHGKATIYAAPGQTIEIEGEWRVEPPDRATVETYLADKGPSTARSLGIENGRGWMRVKGKDQPMDAATLSNERDQFYLYHVLRLVPLLEADYTVTMLAPDGDGRPGLRARLAGRRDVDLYFDRDHRVVRMTTAVRHPMLKADVPEELRLSGTVEAGGIKWPQRIQILQRGEPFFDLELRNFRTLEKF